MRIPAWLRFEEPPPPKLKRPSRAGKARKVDEDEPDRCWICLEDHSEKAEKLIHACHCVNMVVHESCLLKWIKTNKPNEPFSPAGGADICSHADEFSRCSACRTPLEITEHPIFTRVLNPLFRWREWNELACYVVGITLFVATLPWLAMITYGAFALRSVAGGELTAAMLRRCPWRLYFHLSYAFGLLLAARLPEGRAWLPHYLGALAFFWPDTPVLQIIRWRRRPRTCATLEDHILGTHLGLFSRRLPTSVLSTFRLWHIVVLLRYALLRRVYRRLFDREPNWIRPIVRPSLRIERGDIYAVPLGANGWQILGQNSNSTDARRRRSQEESSGFDDVDDGYGRLAKLILSTLVFPFLARRTGDFLLRTSVAWAPWLCLVLGFPDVATAARFATTPPDESWGAILSGTALPLGSNGPFVDPVWWRSAVGGAVLVVVPDTVEIAHGLFYNWCTKHMFAKAIAKSRPTPSLFFDFELSMARALRDLSPSPPLEVRPLPRRARRRVSGQQQ